MAISPLKSHIKSIAAALDEPYDTAEEAAETVLNLAFDIYEARAKWTVVGQVIEPGNGGDKVALGHYATETQAMNDALKLTMSAQTHEEALVWVLPVHNDTPNSWFVARKKAKKADDLADLSFREKELQYRLDWVADHPGEPVPEEWHLTPYSSQVEKCPTCLGLGKVRNYSSKEGDE